MEVISFNVSNNVKFIFNVTSTEYPGYKVLFDYNIHI